MPLFNAIIAFQVLLYILLGTVLYFPGKLIENNANSFLNYFNYQQPKTTTTTTTTSTSTSTSTTTTTPAPKLPTICTTSGCGLCESVTDLGGIISSPNYPDDYGVNRACIYNIQVPEGSKIQLTFTTFIVERQYDWIDVYNENNQVIATSFRPGVSLTGFTIPSSITSTSNIMTVHFRSDRSNSGLVENGIETVGKWQATYTVV